LLAAQPVITEFMAANDGTLADGDLQFSDWIEVYNAGDVGIDLVGWHLTDDAMNMNKWTFPSVNLAPGGFLVVFASGQSVEGYVDAGGRLHTDFRLGAAGEFLALVQPDGSTIASQFAPTFPQQIPDVSYGVAMIGATINDDVKGYFLNPTPGEPNASQTDDIGPLVTSVEHAPAQPQPLEPLIVTAEFEPGQNPIAAASLTYGFMFGRTVTVPMVDDGTGADLAAADGLYTGEIPGGRADLMIRYYITVEDAGGKQTRAPRITDTTGTDQSPRFFGTVVVDPGAESELPVFHWFAEDTAAGHTRAGTRGSVYFAGEFYDNIFIRQRGGATNGNSQKFNFNDDQPFFVNDKLGRVQEINLNAQGSDPSYVRQTLAFEAHRDMGVPSSESFLVRMQANSSFDRVGVFIEQVDEDFLERNGYDPDGALYKFVQRSNLNPAFFDTITGIEKKTRLNEDFSDIQAVVDGLRQRSAVGRRDFIYDNFNVPELLNYLAARSITLDADDVRKNFYMYRDTNGTDEWSIFPWDKDWTFGVLGDGGTHLRHPFFGDEEHAKQNANQWNVLYDVVFETPDLQQSYLRRLRTMMDERLKPAGTPADELVFEPRVDELFAPAAADLGGGPAGALASVKSFFNGRRNDLFVTHSGGGAGIPSAQVGNPQINFGAINADGSEDPGEIVYNPISGNQDEEYISLVNPASTPVDISGWQLTGGVSITFQPGVVIPAGGTLYVSPDVRSFRQRATGPSGGQGLFVQGGYQGHISNFGETIRLVAADGETVASVTTPFVPSDAQQFLRVTEIMYNPAEPSAAEIAAGFTDNDDFEFIELTNIGDAALLNLDGVHFSQGIQFVFPEMFLPSGESVVLVRNLAAFSARYDAAGMNIAGEFRDPIDGSNRLDNGGETLRLDDATGSTILDFQYDDAWYPSTDGDGHSLVIVDATADSGAWGESTSWRASAQVGGSPGEHARNNLPGDANGDGRVDIDDLNLVRNNFGGVGAGVAGDTNGDGVVNIDDLNAVRNNFGAVLAPAQLSAAAVDLLFDQSSLPRASTFHQLRHRPGLRANLTTLSSLAPSAESESRTAQAQNSHVSLRRMPAHQSGKIRSSRGHLPEADSAQSESRGGLIFVDLLDEPPARP